MSSQGTGHCYRLVDSSGQEYDLELGMVILVNIDTGAICVGREGRCGYHFKWGRQVVRDFRCPMPLMALHEFIRLLAKEYGLNVEQSTVAHSGFYSFEVVIVG